MMKPSQTRNVSLAAHAKLPLQFPFDNDHQRQSSGIANSKCLHSCDCDGDGNIELILGLLSGKLVVFKTLQQTTPWATSPPHSWLYCHRYKWFHYSSTPKICTIHLFGRQCSSSVKATTNNCHFSRRSVLRVWLVPMQRWVRRTQTSSMLCHHTQCSNCFGSTYTRCLRRFMRCNHWKIIAPIWNGHRFHIEQIRQVARRLGRDTKMEHWRGSYILHGHHDK